MQLRFIYIGKDGNVVQEKVFSRVDRIKTSYDVEEDECIYKGKEELLEEA